MLLATSCGGRTDIEGSPADAGDENLVRVAPNSVVLFGGEGDDTRVSRGMLGDTWAWDGLAWTQLQTSGPLPREAAAGGALGGKLVVFGGWGVDEHLPLNDTWTFDGAAWAQVPAQLPDGMAGGLAYGMAVPLDGALLLLGGQRFSGGSYHGYWYEWEWDMRSFDGTGWSQFGTTLPSMHYRGDAVPEPYQRAVSLGDKILLFGDHTPQGAALGDMWSFDGAAWQPIAAKGPGGRFGAVLTTIGDKALLFGGSTDWLGESNFENDTWLFDGTSWTSVPGDAPSPRIDAAAAERDGKVVLFGGWDGKPMGDTWVFDGASWKQMDVDGPSPRSGATMVTMP